MIMKIYRHIFPAIIALAFTTNVLSQQGGSTTYDFLTFPNSARIGSLGGNQVGLYDNDLNLLFHNPGMLSDSMDNQLVINYVPMVAGINWGFFGYARHLNNIGTLAIGIHNINYGNFKRTNEFDEDLGIFKAAEYAILLSYSKKLSKNLIGGITFKPIISQFENYNSFALASDIGFSYRSNSQLFSAGIVLKNIGSQITAYDGIEEKLPTDLQVGFSNKLAHAPFRFSFTFQGLLEWDLNYQLETPENGSTLNIEDPKKIKPFDNLMRHTVFGLEFLPFKNFYIAMGYNHRIRQELKLEEKASTVGYSWGFGFRVYKFNFAYGSARYNIAGSSNYFSLTTNLSKFGL